MLAALRIERRHLVRGAGDFLAEIVELVRHLGEKLHHRAGARRSGERARLFSIGQTREARRGHLDIGQQALRRERVVVGAIEVARIALRHHRKMLLDRRGAGERRRIEPGRHGNDHQRAEAHAAEQQRALALLADLREEAHQISPEGVDADRHRGGVNHRREEHDGGVAVEQVAHAEIRIDSARQRQYRERHAAGGF